MGIGVEAARDASSEAEPPPHCHDAVDQVRPWGTTSTQILRAVRMTIVVELWGFMRERKKFWLLPIIVLMFAFSGSWC
jgi:hypothetical protein